MSEVTIRAGRERAEGEMTVALASVTHYKELFLVARRLQLHVAM